MLAKYLLRHEPQEASSIECKHDVTDSHHVEVGSLLVSEEDVWCPNPIPVFMI